MMKAFLHSNQKYLPYNQNFIDRLRKTNQVYEIWFGDEGEEELILYKNIPSDYLSHFIGESKTDIENQIQLTRNKILEKYSTKFSYFFELRENMKNRKSWSYPYLYQNVVFLLVKKIK